MRNIARILFVLLMALSVSCVPDNSPVEMKEMVGSRRRHRHGLLSGAERRRCRCWTDHGLLHPVPEPTVPRI